MGHTSNAALRQTQDKLTIGRWKPKIRFLPLPSKKLRNSSGSRNVGGVQNPRSLSSASIQTRARILSSRRGGSAPTSPTAKRTCRCGEMKIPRKLKRMKQSRDLWRSGQPGQASKRVERVKSKRRRRRPREKRQRKRQNERRKRNSGPKSGPLF